MSAENPFQPTSSSLGRSLLWFFEFLDQARSISIELTTKEISASELRALTLASWFLSSGKQQFTVAEVIEEFGLKKSTLGESYKSLETKGLIFRVEPNKDGRTTPYYISESGRQMFDRIAEAIAIRFEHASLRSDNKKDLAAIGSLTDIFVWLDQLREPERYDRYLRMMRERYPACNVVVGMAPKEDSNL
jgi:DNA-binding MarR family transcriptional regulator